jgi:hypothetical protein
MALPNPGMDAVPFTPLTAEFLDDMIENIESLSDGTGFENGAITTNTLADNGVTIDKIDSSGYPRFIASKNVSQGGATTGTVIAYPAKELDTHNAYSTANSRFTAPISGTYMFMAGAFANGAANTGLIINISKNGVAQYRGGDGAGSAFERGSNVVALVQLSAGDYVDVRIQYIAGTSNIEGFASHKFSGFMVFGS